MSTKFDYFLMIVCVFFPIIELPFINDIFEFFFVFSISYFFLLVLSVKISKKSDNTYTIRYKKVYQILSKPYENNPNKRYLGKYPDGYSTTVFLVFFVIFLIIMMGYLFIILYPINKDEASYLLLFDIIFLCCTQDLIRSARVKMAKKKAIKLLEDSYAYGNPTLIMMLMPSWCPNCGEPLTLDSINWVSPSRIECKNCGFSIDLAKLAFIKIEKKYNYTYL